MARPRHFLEDDLYDSMAHNITHTRTLSLSISLGLSCGLAETGMHLPTCMFPGVQHSVRI